MIRNREELAACRSEYSEGRFRGPAKMRLLMDSLESAFERIEEAEQSIFNTVSYTHLTLPTIYSV